MNIKRSIVNAHKMNPNVDSLVTLVRAILSNMNYSDNSEIAENPDEVRTALDHPADNILLGVANSIQQNKADNIIQILKACFIFIF